MQIQNLYILLLFAISFSSCVKTNDKEIVSYFQHTGDSLSLKSYLYLKSHIDQADLERLTINTKFLIQDIQQAVSTYRKKLKSNDIPFELFAEYILPPIIEYEPLENWRERCNDEFSFLNTWDLVSTCDTINGLLKKDFSFSYEMPPSQYMSWSQLDTLHKGDCFHMAKSVLYPLRALGYPVAIDFSPCWGNTTGAHAWNVIYIDGKMVPFMGREKEPYAYEPFRIYDYKDSVKMQVTEPYRYPAKVYRKTFSRNKELQKMIEQIPETDLPAFMRDSRIKDVTADYLPVTDVKVELNKRVHSGEQVYLAVYSDDWTITAWAEQQEEKIAYFKDVKRKMLYLPVVYRKGIVYPIASPFVIDETGHKRDLKPNGQTETCSVHYLLPLRQELTKAVANKDSLPKDIFDRLYTGEKRKRPKEGNVYSLYCWDWNRWKYVGTSQGSNGQLTFERVPANTLLFLADEKGEFIGRCFTIENEKMIWW